MLLIFFLLTATWKKKFLFCSAHEDLKKLTVDQQKLSRPQVVDAAAK